jgi:hypothetical protein
LLKLVGESFQGSICCTRTTSEIAKIMLLDAGRLQQEDGEFKRGRGTSVKGGEVLPPKFHFILLKMLRLRFRFFHVR